MKSMNVATVVALLVTINFVIVSSDTDVNNDFTKSMKIVESVSGKFFNDVYQNGTFRTGNVLWDNILNQCTVKPSVSCLQKNVYSYLDENLDFTGDVEVTSGVCFKKNNVDINKYSKEANIIYLTGGNNDKLQEKHRLFDENNEVDDSEEPGNSIFILFYSTSIHLITNV